MRLVLARVREQLARKVDDAIGGPLVQPRRHAIDADRRVRLHSVIRCVRFLATAAATLHQPHHPSGAKAVVLVVPLLPHARRVEVDYPKPTGPRRVVRWLRLGRDERMVVHGALQGRQEYVVTLPQVVHVDSDRPRWP
eukprot:735582-Prymnesium_polylepis.2